MIEMIEKIIREFAHRIDKETANLIANAIVDRIDTLGYEIVKKG